MHVTARVVRRSSPLPSSPARGPRQPRPSLAADTLSTSNTFSPPHRAMNIFKRLFDRLFRQSTPPQPQPPRFSSTALPDALRDVSGLPCEE